MREYSPTEGVPAFHYYLTEIKQVIQDGDRWKLILTLDHPQMG